MGLVAVALSLLRVVGHERERKAHARQRGTPPSHQREPHRERPQEQLQRDRDCNGGRGLE